jgi:hypothetical protein
MIADFNVKQYAKAMAFTINCTLTGIYAECADASLDAISALQPQLNSSVTFSSTDMDNFCGKLVAQFTLQVNSTSCLQNDPLFAQLQSQVDASNGFQYLCSNTVRPAFLANQKCFTSTLDAATRACSNTSFSPSMSNADACKAYDTIFRCVYNTTRTTCTDGVSRMMTTMTVKNTEQYLNVLYGCRFDVSSYWYSQTSFAVKVSPGFSFLLSAILVACLGLVTDSVASFAQ